MARTSQSRLGGAGRGSARPADRCGRHPAVVMFGSTADPQRRCWRSLFAIGPPLARGFDWPLAGPPPEGEVFPPCAAACLNCADAFPDAKRVRRGISPTQRMLTFGMFRPRCKPCRGPSSAAEQSGFARRYGTGSRIWCSGRDGDHRGFAGVPKLCPREGRAARAPGRLIGVALTWKP